MQYIFTGSYTGPDGKDGVRCFAVSPEGKLTLLCTADAHSPTYVVYRDGLLYACGRTPSGCCVHTFSFDGRGLTPAHRLDAPGGSLCHLSVVGHTLYASCYPGGALLRCPLGADGIPTGALARTVYTGGGAHPRQDGAHIHSAFPSPDNRFLLVCDLGSDRIYNYCIRPSGELVPNPEQAEIATAAGAGPRHLTYNREGTRVYAVTELSRQVLVYARDPETGLLYELQTSGCAPETAPADTLSADIHLSDDGHCLYASSRGADCIALFHVLEDGTLSEPFYLPSFTAGPRHFSFQPGGAHIVITGQYSGTVVVCPVDRRTGLYVPAIDQVSVPQATCAQWVEI